MMGVEWLHVNGRYQPVRGCSMRSGEVAHTPWQTPQPLASITQIAVVIRNTSLAA
jgi:hypothetical protein